jgi:hypothetical protein
MMVAISPNSLSFSGKFNLFYTTYGRFRQPWAPTKTEYPW